MLMLSGCQATPPGPYDPPTEENRDPSRAQRLSKEAAGLIDSDPDEAEALLREALGADLFCGPAHNNLGVILLARGDFYEAAQEFEWARKLLPGNPDPRVNLAITLERAGQAAQAIEAYEAALAVASEYLPAVQGLTALLEIHGVSFPQRNERLRQIMEWSESAEWRNWASDRLLGRGGLTEASHSIH